MNEFLGPNMMEYSSFLISDEQMSYEDTAKNFENDGFFDCELGNAAILALANIWRIGIVVFTSLENYPVITIVPRNEPISCTTVYLAFELVIMMLSLKVLLLPYKQLQPRKSQDLAKITRNQLPVIIQTRTFLIQHVDVAKEVLKINKTDNSVQSTSPVVNAFAVYKAAQWCVVAEIVQIHMEFECRVRTKSHQEPKHENAASI